MSRLALLTLSALLQAPQLAIAQAANQDLVCVPLENQAYKKPVCSWSKEVNAKCEAQAPGSIFSQCNVFKININQKTISTDDNGSQYLASIFKFSETNSCKTGENDGISLTGRCDTFAVYAQIFRNKSTNKCYAMVNSALIGDQLMELGARNNPNKQVTKVEIPGVSRRIIFTPSTDSVILKQSNASLIKTKDKKRPFTHSGQAISPLQLLELESPLTTKAENLKPNPAKIRISRGQQQESKDFFDILLNRKQENTLNSILGGCA